VTEGGPTDATCADVIEGQTSRRWLLLRDCAVDIESSAYEERNHRPTAAFLALRGRAEGGPVALFVRTVGVS
jgi:hypothetical protein